MMGWSECEDWSDEDESALMALVMDFGSGLTKAGFAGDDVPRAVFQSTKKDLFVCDEALAKRCSLRVKHVIQRGRVVDWERFERLCHHTFYNELCVAPEERSVLCTDSVLNPKVNRAKMAEIMFETFNVPKFYVSTQSLLSLFASGRGTGIVCDSGHGVTNTVPIFDGNCLSHAVRSVAFAGMDLTAYLQKILEENGYSMTTSAEMEIVRDIKEKLCYVSHDFDKELTRFENESSAECSKDYELPSGHVIRCNSARIRCAEALFQPALAGMHSDGIHKLTFDSVSKCDAETRKELLANVVLSAGNTMFDGIDERMRRELRALASDKSVRIKVVAAPERKFCAWIGGSILASTFQNIWVSKEEYNQSGQGIVYRKCL